MERENRVIYSLRGKLILIENNFAVIECGGVGYKCMCSAFTQEFLKNYIEKETTMYTYMNVHQDAVELFGFYNTSELECFKFLISVSGVGAKVALGILSHFSSEKIKAIISEEDIKSLTDAPGIGTKTAKRIILELKDKFSELKISSLSNQNIVSSTNKKKETLNALAVLGYSKSEVMPYVSNLSESLSVEEMITITLKYITHKGV